jgi:hypothetical protein
LTWIEAWNYCCSFDMQLVSIETTLRHACLSKFAKSLKAFFIILIISIAYIDRTGFAPVVNIEHWTSGTDRGYNAKHVWCNSKNFLNMKEVNWKSGQPNLADGHCMFFQFSDKSANQTFVSMGDCSEKRKFICQVLKFKNSCVYQ